MPGSARLLSTLVRPWSCVITLAQPDRTRLSGQGNPPTAPGSLPCADHPAPDGNQVSDLYTPCKTDRHQPADPRGPPANVYLEYLLEFATSNFLRKISRRIFQQEHYANFINLSKKNVYVWEIFGWKTSCRRA